MPLAIFAFVVFCADLAVNGTNGAVFAIAYIVQQLILGL